jgi:hypothetical protein
MGGFWRNSVFRVGDRQRGILVLVPLLLHALFRQGWAEVVVVVAVKGQDFPLSEGWRMKRDSAKLIAYTARICDWRVANQRFVMV